MAVIFIWDERPSAKTDAVWYSLFALSLPACLFYLWGSTSPNVEGQIVSREFIKPVHFVLSTGYALMIMLFLAPHFLVPISQHIILAYLGLVLVVTIFNAWIGFSSPVVATLTSKVLPPLLYEYFGYFTAANLVLLGLYFAYCMGTRMIERRHDTLFVTFSTMLALMLISNAMITHQFSSRYVFQAAPLFVLLAAYYQRPAWYRSILLIAGLAVGIISLMSYY